MESLSHIAREWRRRANKLRGVGELTIAETLETCAAEVGAHLTTVKDIQRQACQQFGVSMDQLLSGSRIREVVEARNTAMRRCQEKIPSITLGELGKHFNRSHATVLYGLRQAKKNRRKN